MLVVRSYYLVSFDKIPCSVSSLMHPTSVQSKHPHLVPLFMPNYFFSGGGCDGLGRGLDVGGNCSSPDCHIVRIDVLELY